MVLGKKSEKGQALFELALVLTLLLVMIAGVMAIGPSSYARIATDAAGAVLPRCCSSSRR